MPTTPEAIEELKHAPDVAGVQDLILQRWSPRAFSDKPVSDELLKTLFEAARWAASSSNEQPWRFLVGKRGDETYKKILASLVEFNQNWVKAAPVLILAVAKKTFTEKGMANRYNLHDTGAATATLALQATASGLHAHSMAGFDAEQVRASFAIPTEYDIAAVTALGYFGDPESLPDYMKKMEVAPRQRKSLEELVFTEWDNPAKF